MRHTTRWQRRATAAALALALGLAACGGDELQAETRAGEDADDDRVAELEAQLAEARGDASEGGAGDAPIVIELGETRRTGEDQDLEVTVHQASIHEFWVEVDVTVRHLGTEGRAAIWGSGGSKPRLYDEQDRRFEYQHPAGTDSIIRLEAGQTADATLVFAGRLHPDARQVTLGLDGLDLRNETFTFPLPEVGR